MRGRYRARLQVALVAACAAAVLLAPVAFGAPAGSLALYEVGVAKFPVTTVRVGLPDAVIGTATETPTFTIAENGAPVDVISARLGSGSSPSDVVLVVDCSGSMAGRPLADAKRAAHRFVDDVDGTARVAIVSFSSEPHVVSTYSSSPAALHNAIDALTAGGETASYDAVVQATRLKRDADSGLGTIVLLSDGADDSSTGTLDQAVQAARASTMPILTVALHTPDLNQQALGVLASKSGGRLVSVADSAKLAEHFGSIAREVSSVYEVTYRSARPATKNIDVDVTARTSRGEAAASTTIDNPLYVGKVPLGDSVIVPPQSNTWLYIGAVTLAFCSVGILATVLVGLTGRRVRLEQMRFYDQLHGSPSEPEAVAGSGGMRRKVVAAVGEVAGRGGFTHAIHLELERAGLPLRPAEYIASHVALVSIAGLLSQLVLDDLRLSFGIILFASVAPVFYLRSRGRKRTRDFEAQLPDVLNLLSGGLRTGWGLQQAIDLVVTEGGPPACEEFRRVQIEARLGVPVESALEEMGERIDSDAFRWVVSAVSIQREVGGNLAEVLDNVAKSVRDRDALLRQVSALTAEGRLSAIVLTALPFLVAGGIFLVAPDYILTGLRSPLGVPLVVLAAVLLIAGVIWLRSVSRIEY